MKIAVIPARTGSKRIKNKNFKIFHDKPIIEIVIDKILKFNFFDKIFVTINDKKICNYYKKYSSKINILYRDEAVSNDDSTIYDVMQYSLKQIKRYRIQPKFICCIYPTSVFIDKKNLVKGYMAIQNQNYDYSFGVKLAEKSIDSFFKLDKNLNLVKSKNQSNSNIKKNTYYTDAGQFCWGKYVCWNSKQHVFTSNTKAIKLNPSYVYDIDTVDDWNKALIAYKIINNNNLNQTKNMKIINQIQNIRSKNNVNWMGILKVAFRNSPNETLKLLKEINEKDNLITKAFKNIG